MEVVYRKRFVNKLDKLLRYISNEFGEKGIKTLQTSFQKKLATIKKFPQSGYLTKQEAIRFAIIGKHIAIYYKTEKTKLIILNMFDMRMDPEKTPYS